MQCSYCRFLNLTVLLKISHVLFFLKLQLVTSCKWIRITAVFQLKKKEVFWVSGHIKSAEKVLSFLSEAYHSLIRSTMLARELRRKRKERKSSYIKIHSNPQIYFGLDLGFIHGKTFPICIMIILRTKIQALA